MKLSVYSLQTTEGNAEHGENITQLKSKHHFHSNFCFAGKQSKLNLCFEHKLKKHAFSLCKGNFGGYKSREFFCITHLDGTLSFFEQDGITYSCTLNGERNIPSPMAYNPRTDSFVLVSSEGELECYRWEWDALKMLHIWNRFEDSVLLYRYQDLGQVMEHKTENIFPGWTICLGDFALAISVQQTAK